MMKKINSIVSLSLIVFFLVVFSFPSICFSEPDSKVWKSFGDDWYYNKKTLTKSSNIVSVWTYRTVTDEEKKQKMEIVKKEDSKKSIKYTHYDHYLGLWEIDCVKKLFRGKEFKDYDNKGKVISSLKHLFDWKNIKPNSVMNNLYDNVCVIPKKPSKKEK
jgi:hypothetical protein